MTDWMKDDERAEGRPPEDDFKSRSAMKRVMATDPYRMIAEVERLRGIERELRMELGARHGAIQRLRHALERIENPLSAQQENPARPVGFADWELRAIARNALQHEGIVRHPAKGEP